MARRRQLTPTGAPEAETTRVLGVPVHALRMADVLDACDAAIARGAALRIGVVNAAKLVAMRDDAMLREDVLSSDLVLADGMAVVWASRWLGQPLPERIAGIDLFEALLARAAAHGHPVYLLGAKPDVLEALCRRLREQHPALRIAGASDGYFDEARGGEVAAAIARSGARMLFVGMSSPKKERFLARHEAQLGVQVLHGVGGSFDVLAGRTRRAPPLWQRLGLEWLYRLLQEPRRMWRRYLLTNPRFVLGVLRQRRGARRARRGAVRS